MAPAANRLAWREVAREAWRNTTGGVSHALRWALLLALILGGLAWLETDAIRRIDDSAAQMIAGRGATWMLQAPGRIAGNSCEALNRADGVVAAGALRSLPEPVTILGLPGAPVPAFAATPGLAKVLDARQFDGTTPVDGIVLSRDAAQASGRSLPGDLPSEGEALAVTAVYDWPNDGRRSGFGYAALALSAPVGVFDECWVQVWPADQGTLALARTALLPSETNEPVQISQVNPALGTSMDFAAEYASRTTRWLAPAVVLLGALLAAATVWMRRLELASALHAGVPKSQQLVQVLIETAVWTSAGALLAAPVPLLIARSALQDPSAIALAGVRCILLGVCGALLGATVAVAGIREAQLFKLFKGR